MGDTDDEGLEQLAKLAVSGRHVLIMVVVALGIGGGVGGGLSALGLEPRTVVVSTIAAMVAAFGVVMRIRTPASAFPAIRVLRDRPGDVVHIVSIHRGKDFLVLVGRDGRFLAKPLVLKGSASAIRSPGKAIAEDATTGSAAARIASTRCPQARVAKIVDAVGLSSLQKLAKKAIASLPS